MLAVKLLGAASAYALAWWVSRHEGPAAYGRFELALTVLTIAALVARLGLDGVLVKWMAASKVKGEEGEIGGRISHGGKLREPCKDTSALLKAIHFHTLFE